MVQQDKSHRKVRKVKEGPNFSGQHFLHDKRVIHELMKAAKITSTDTVLDIGAGRGAISFPLAERAGRVIAIEYDEKLAEYLLEKSTVYPGLKVIQQNILDYRLPKEPFCVVSNIPYSITTSIMKKLLSNPQNKLQRAALVLEKGAAKRFTTSPIMDPTILVWRMWFDIKVLRTIPRDKFSPIPRVDAALLLATRRDTPLVQPQHHRLFAALATYALSYPRAPLIDVFRGIFTPGQMKHLLRNIGAHREQPVYMLTAAQWGEILNTMLKYVDRARWPRVKK